MINKTNHILSQRFEDPLQTPTGRLKFGVFTEDMTKPIENASIRLFERVNDGENEIENEITDVSGQTLELDLKAPNEEFSQHFQTEVRPYSQYDAQISAEGFTDVFISGIEILANTTAIQNVNLVNRSGVQAPVQTSSKTFVSAQSNILRQEEVITISEHTLWADYPPKIPEAAVKDLSPATGFVVLDEVVVPQTVVVHDGTPEDNSAPNYYVPFNDYVKNVASSEIYSTWSDAAIRANILAILSFTLNRVYTEWYRNKGKNFTITSSTAYDHKFVYGRNIYENISVIVDEMFSTYITKEGILQPLFTQYCDGKRTDCPGWLSQWGSKDLGDRGYSALNILRNYYGYDIYLEQARKVAGIPVSFTRNLQEGDNNSDVRTIQNQLNRISDNFPAIPKVRADGVFGAQTREAVEMFQTTFNLPASGIVDYPTWYKISDLYVAVSKIA